MRRRARTAAVAGLGAVVILAVTGCSTNGAATPARPVPATSSAPGSSLPSPPPVGDASVTACTAYANATGLPRTVVATSMAKPVLGPAVALVLINLRGIVSATALPGDPGLQLAFVELTNAVDDLSTQLSAGLPAGASAVTTPVTVLPARLAAALDAADALCTVRGVSPKAG